MSKITVKKLSAKKAFQMLNSFQNNYAKSYGVQGNKSCRYINTNLITATVRSNDDLIDRRFEELEYCFELVSNYYSQDNLENFFESEFTASL